MVRRIFFSLALIFVVCCSFGQKVFINKSSEVSFYSVAPLENIEAHNSSMSSMLNTATGEIAFSVPIRNFRFKKELMQEHFNEKYLESDRFPQSTFQGRFEEVVDYKQNGTYPVNVHGKLTIHGITKEVSEPGKIVIAGTEIQAETEFAVAVGEYGIRIPQLLFENIADTVTVKIHVTYQPYEK